MVTHYRAEEFDLAQPDLWNTAVKDPQLISHQVDTATSRRRVHIVPPAYHQEASPPWLLDYIHNLAAPQPAYVLIDEGTWGCTAGFAHY